MDDKISVYVLTGTQPEYDAIVTENIRGVLDEIETDLENIEDVLDETLTYTVRRDQMTRAEFEALTSIY